MPAPVREGPSVEVMEGQKASPSQIWFPHAGAWTLREKNVGKQKRELFAAEAEVLMCSQLYCSPTPPVGSRIMENDGMKGAAK